MAQQASRAAAEPKPPALLDLIGAAGGLPSAASRPPSARRTDYTVAELMALTDSEIERIDPIVMNLTVAKGLPECVDLDIPKYVATVDEWAIAVAEKNARDEAAGPGTGLLRKDRDQWLVGGMALTLATKYGVGATTARLDPGNPEQHFVHGVIDRRRGNCASIPVVYSAIGQRLGWPLHEVVVADHCWSRWDDGIPPDRGGKRFNIESTNVNAPGHEGQFNMISDEDYIREHKVPPIAVSSGSEMSSLTRRECLGAYLQTRASCWRTKGSPECAEADLLLGMSCFPRSRSLRILLMTRMSQSNPAYLAPRELRLVADAAVRACPPAKRPIFAPPPRARVPIDPHEEMLRRIEAVNRENARRINAALAPPRPSPSPIPGTAPGSWPSNTAGPYWRTP
jgi:hypothetical protein